MGAIRMGDYDKGNGCNQNVNDDKEMGCNQNVR
jgi:hypothetical protein